jgi:hypothetical protein
MSLFGLRKATAPPQKAFVHRDDCKVLRTTWSAWLTF